MWIIIAQYAIRPIYDRSRGYKIFAFVNPPTLNPVKLLRLIVNVKYLNAIT